MIDDATTRSDARFGEYEIIQTLHDVPPHEVYEVTVDGRRAVHKFDTGPTGSAGIEGRVLAFVGEQTSIPVPEIIAVGDDCYVAGWHLDAPAPDTSPEADETWARAAGRGLATLHTETAPHVDRFGRFTLESNRDRLVVDGHSGWHTAAVDYVRRLENVVAEFGHADVATAALEHFREHPDAFQGSGEPVLCHGWWTPEHVAVRDDSSTEAAVRCVVDWEHAMAAPAEWDYWRTILPTFDGGDAHRAFRDGYESVRALPAGFKERRPMYLLLVWLYYFESLYVQAQHDAAETERRADFFRERVFEILDGA